MTQVVDAFKLGPAISISTLKPGQIGKVCGNGGTNNNDCFVLGIPHTKVQQQDGHYGYPQMQIAYAVNLQNGGLVTNSSTNVEAYPDHYYLQLRPGQNMGKVE